MHPPSKGVGPLCSVCAEHRSVPAGGLAVWWKTLTVWLIAHLQGQLFHHLVWQRQEEETVPWSGQDSPLGTASPDWLERQNEMKRLL